MLILLNILCTNHFYCYDTVTGIFMNDNINTEFINITHTFNKDYFFGVVYKDYDKFYDWQKYAKELMERYPFDSFLDVGCGCGNLAKEIKTVVERQSKKEHDIQGVDASAFAVKRANVPFVKLADCRDLPFEDNRFDLVYVLTTFSYLPSLADIKLAIRESYRVAKRLVVFDDVFSVPDKDSYEYDPRRQIVYFQEQWLQYWKEVLQGKDRAAIRDYEIVIKKNYHGA